MPRWLCCSAHDVPLPLPLQSSVLFATLQQATGAQEAFAQGGAAGQAPATTSLVSIPLHAPLQQAAPSAPFPAAPTQQQQQPAPQVPQQRPAQFPPAGAPPLPAAALSQAAPAQAVPPPQVRQQAAGLQPQGDSTKVGSTMRPLYAAPRTGQRPVLAPAPGYPYCPPGWHSFAQPPARPAAPQQPAGQLPGPAPPPFHHLAPQQQAAPVPAAASQQPQRPSAPAPLPRLPDSLSSSKPGEAKQLNPAAVSFSPSKPGQAAAAAAAAAKGQAAAPPTRAGSAPPVVSPPACDMLCWVGCCCAPALDPCHPPVLPPLQLAGVISAINDQIDSALRGRSFVPAWDRMATQAAPAGQPLVMAEAVAYESGTEGGLQRWGGRLRV